MEYKKQQYKETRKITVSGVTRVLMYCQVHSTVRVRLNDGKCCSQATFKQCESLLHEDRKRKMSVEKGILEAENVQEKRLNMLSRR